MGSPLKIPTIHNDKNAGEQFSEAELGKVDLYGWDGYPQGFDCDNPSKWTELSTQVKPAEPLALFKWQGGAFSYWSGPGYEECYKLINEQFVNVSVLQGRSLVSVYMFVRSHVRWIECFLHASPDYLVAGRLGVSNSSGIYTTHLHSLDTDANFYFVRQASVVTLADTDLTLKVNTTLEGALEIPKGGVNIITLAGRESKIMVTKYPFGSSVLSYTTAEVLTWTTFDGADTIVLYALEGQYVEAVFQGSGTPTVTPTSTLDIAESNGLFTISSSPPGITVFTVDNTRIIVADKKTVGSIWYTPSTPARCMTWRPTSPPSGSVARTSVDGSTPNLVGDLNDTTTLDIFASSEYTSVTWNGEPVAVEETEIATLRGVVTMPTLDFDDYWVVANKTSTFRPQQPFAGKYALYADMASTPGIGYGEGI
ncbi:hypothetical protein BDZ89DRAFT_1131487 [Hymenopellis radicata]|nr:hypothetical protein BDZ89DRAFT_1131487 [Hymenopellis radicata]